ncbi:hypothetical protein DFH11DRAFT_1515139 [Phellopilus nigrolimitatus]|nr:hypothetical protein DFH11DRAFT_1515139 [Phellopilus nigrolimitatus]
MEAWAHVSKSTVANCWKHADILSCEDQNTPVDPALNNDSGITNAISELQGALDKLSVQHIAPKNVPTVEELLEVDGEITTEAEWTDTEILEQVDFNRREANGEHIPELDEPEPEPELVMSRSEACQALAKLDRFFQSCPGDNFAQARALFPKIRNELRRDINESLEQADIRKFFSQ